MTPGNLIAHSCWMSHNLNCCSNYGQTNLPLLLHTTHIYDVDCAFVQTDTFSIDTGSVTRFSIRNQIVRWQFYGWVMIVIAHKAMQDSHTYIIILLSYPFVFDLIGLLWVPLAFCFAFVDCSHLQALRLSKVIVLCVCISCCSFFIAINNCKSIVKETLYPKNEGSTKGQPKYAPQKSHVRKICTSYFNPVQVCITY